MPYNILVDDLFTSKSVTSVGSGANSVGVNGTSGVGIPTTVNSGNGGTSAGWLDFVGNLWQITAVGTGGANDALVNTPQSTNALLNALYRPSAENYQDGYVRNWNPAVQTNASICVARASSGSGGSAYMGMIYVNQQVYIYKTVNGTRTALVSGGTMTGTVIATGNAVTEMVLSTSGGTTTIVINQYNPSNLSTPVATYSITDTTGALQTSGAWGIGGYGAAAYSRAQTAIYNAIGPLVTGTLVADAPANGITQANLVGVAATGGVAPISYQLHRSTSSGFTPTWSGATLVQSPTAGQLATLQDTGLTAATTYYYILMAQDSNTPTPSTVSTTPQVAITTFAANAIVFGFAGDSLTYSQNATDQPASVNVPDTTHSAPGQFASLYNSEQNNNIVYAFNGGVAGTTTGTWQPGQTAYTNAYAAFQKTQATDIFIMLGTNDAHNSVSNAAYKSNMQAIIAGFQGIASLKRIWLNWSPYDGSGSYETTFAGYLTQLKSIVNGTTILMGDSSAHLTLQNVPSPTVYNTSDHIHLTDRGYTMLANLWYKASFRQSTVRPLARGPIGN